LYGTSPRPLFFCCTICSFNTLNCTHSLLVLDYIIMFKHSFFSSVSLVLVLCLCPPSFFCSSRYLHLRTSSPQPLNLVSLRDLHPLSYFFAPASQASRLPFECIGLLRYSSLLTFDSDSSASLTRDPIFSAHILPCETCSLTPFPSVSFSTGCPPVDMSTVFAGRSLFSLLSSPTALSAAFPRLRPAPR